MKWVRVSFEVEVEDHVRPYEIKDIMEADLTLNAWDTRNLKIEEVKE